MKEVSKIKAFYLKEKMNERLNKYAKNKQKRNKKEKNIFSISSKSLKRQTTNDFYETSPKFNLKNKILMEKNDINPGDVANLQRLFQWINSQNPNKKDKIFFIKNKFKIPRLLTEDLKMDSTNRTNFSEHKIDNDNRRVVTDRNEKNKDFEEKGYGLNFNKLTKKSKFLERNKKNISNKNLKTNFEGLLTAKSNNSKFGFGDDVSRITQNASTISNFRNSSKDVNGSYNPKLTMELGSRIRISLNKQERQRVGKKKLKKNHRIILKNLNLS